MVEILKISAVNVAILICLIKWGIAAKWQYYAPRWLPQSCNFCLFFWLTMLRLIILKRPQKHLVFEGVMMVSDALCIAVVSLLIFKFLKHEDFGK